MKRFLVRISIFFTVGFFLLYGIGELFLRYPVFAEKIGYSESWFRVYKIASRSKEDINSEILYLGDSGAGQMFPYTEQKHYLPINGAILIPGQYILASNVIKANPNLKSIVLIANPLSIAAKFEDSFTCNNFVKPFYTKENLPHFSDLLLKKVTIKPVTKFYKYGFVKLLPFSDIDYFNQKPELTILSDISLEYIRKLVALCRKNNISLTIHSGAVDIVYKEKTNDWTDMKAQIKNEGLTEVFRGFFEHMKYYESNQFITGQHLRKEYLADFKTYILQNQKQLVPKN